MLAIRVIRSLLIVGALIGGSVAVAAQRPRPKPVSVEVFKSPTCGCCSKWVDHMRAAGFSVMVRDLNERDLKDIKDKAGVPSELRSCHTARIGRYTVEGHVPAADVRTLLKDQPKVSGIAVGGMPAGSPGMEIPSGRVQRYEVRTFDAKGAGRVFATHGQ